MLRLRVLSALSALALVSSAMAQQTPPNYNRLLLPLIFNGSGALGSQWVTEVAATNTGETSLVFGTPVFYQPPFCTCTADTQVLSGQSRMAVVSHDGNGDGLWLYVPKEAEVESLHWSARARDVSRDALTAGTELPIVPFSSFAQSRIVLYDVPTDARFRSGLRIYGESEGEVVQLNLYDSRFYPRALPLASSSVTLHVSSPQTAGGLPIHPSYAFVADLVAKFPEVAAVPKLVVELRPSQFLTSPPRTSFAWGMVSITNNVTQQVTLVTPQGR